MRPRLQSGACARPLNSTVRQARRGRLIRRFRMLVPHQSLFGQLRANSPDAQIRVASSGNWVSSKDLLEGPHYAGTLAGMAGNRLLHGPGSAGHGVVDMAAPTSVSRPNISGLYVADPDGPSNNRWRGP
jgi:hypothetical protein